MIDEPTISDDDTTPMDSNFAATEKLIVKAGRDALNLYERAMERIDKQISVAHQGIIAYGRALKEGRELYPSNQEFKDWIERKKLNFGRFAGDPVERSNCMKIADLVDIGIASEDGIVYRLDLGKCKITAPSNILKWARTDQRHLFPHLPPKTATMFPKPAKPHPKPSSGDDGRLANACGFCGKTAGQVNDLLLGPAARPGSAICDGCVTIAVELVAERKHPKGKPRTFEQALRAPLDGRGDETADLWPESERRDPESPEPA